MIAVGSKCFSNLSLPLPLSLRQVIEEFELRLATGGKSGHLIKAVDSRFRKHIQELHLRYTKVIQRLCMLYIPILRLFTLPSLITHSLTTTERATCYLAVVCGGRGGGGGTRSMLTWYN